MKSCFWCECTVSIIQQWPKSEVSGSNRVQTSPMSVCEVQHIEVLCNMTQQSLQIVIIVISHSPLLCVARWSSWISHSSPCAYCRSPDSQTQVRDLNWGGSIAWITVTLGHGVRWCKCVYINRTSNVLLLGDKPLLLLRLIPLQTFDLWYCTSGWRMGLPQHSLYRSPPHRSQTHHCHQEAGSTLSSNWQWTGVD